LRHRQAGSRLSRRAARGRRRMRLPAHAYFDHSAGAEVRTYAFAFKLQIDDGDRPMTMTSHEAGDELCRLAKFVAANQHLPFIRAAQIVMSDPKNAHLVAAYNNNGTRAYERREGRGEVMAIDRDPSGEIDRRARELLIGSGNSKLKYADAVARVLKSHPEL